MVRPTRSSATPWRSGGAARPLWLAAAVVVLLTLLHDLDHLRQGRDLPGALDLIGAAGTTASIVVFVWVARRGALAALAAALFGAVTTVGLVAIHVVPRWSFFSDPYAAADVDAWSWIGLAALIAAGAALAAVGWSRTRSG